MRSITDQIMNSCTMRYRYIAVRPCDTDYDKAYHYENGRHFRAQAALAGNSWCSFHLHEDYVQNVDFTAYAFNDQFGLSKTSVLFFDSIYYFDKKKLVELEE